MTSGSANADASEEHDQVVVTVGGTEDFVPAAAVHGAPLTAQGGGPVRNDRRAAHGSPRCSHTSRAGEGVDGGSARERIAVVDEAPERA